MPSTLSRLAPLRILAIRAAVGYVLLRALLVVASLLLAEFFFSGDADAVDLSNPLGVVLISMALGAVDIRRRGESVLWANLGYSPLVAPGLFGGAALIGELVLAAVRA